MNKQYAQNYLENNGFEKLYLYGYGYTAKQESENRVNAHTRALLPSTFSNFLGIPRIWIESNFDQFLNVLDDQNRIRNFSIARLVKETCKSFAATDPTSEFYINGFEIVTLNKPYSAFAIGKNTTRSTDIELTISTVAGWGGWCGGLSRSAAVDKYMRPLIKSGRIVPDIWRYTDETETETITGEIKCSRGHFMRY